MIVHSVDSLCSNHSNIGIDIGKHNRATNKNRETDPSYTIRVSMTNS